MQAELDAARRQLAIIGNLYVQLRRLHASLRLDDVVAAVKETLVNLVGSEDFAVFLRDDGGRFEKLLEMGAGAALPDFAVGEGALGAAVASGAISYGDPLAAVPLLSGIDGHAMGLIALSGLLPHKPELSVVDRTLLEVFVAHAGVALEAALCARAGAPQVEVRRLRAELAPVAVVAPLDGDEPKP